MQLPSTYYNNNSRVVVGTPQIYTDDVILLCDTSLGPVTINLLEIPDNAWLTTYKLYIIDNSNNASVNNITINAGIGQTINNQSSVVISTNGLCALVRIVGNSQYILSPDLISTFDEGNLLTSNTQSINFVGAGVTATNVGNNVTVTIPASAPTTFSVTDTPTIDLTLTGGPAYNLQADIVDTGWVNLEGFDFYTGSVAKPQCRKIGKAIYFRGLVYIPLSNDGGATVIPLANLSSYFTQFFSDPWTGSGGGFGNGVVLNSFGSLTFNLNNSVIPTSVLPLATNLDGNYSLQQIGVRVIDIPTAPNTSTALSAYMPVSITNDKKLRIQLLKDLEQGQGYASFYAASPLRLITSYVRSTGIGNDIIPEYIGPSSFIHNSPLAASYSLQGFSSASTWPFSVDAAEEISVGGFFVKLDGLTAFIS